MSLQERVDLRGVSEVLHFSTNRGLTGALASRYLLSRPLLRESDLLRHVLQYNSRERPEEAAFFDKSEDWIRFVNLSISEINRRFLDVSRRWHNDSDVWWCVFAFAPEIMMHEGVWFATTNNGYDQCIRGQDEDGFEALFADRIARKANGRYRPWSVPRGPREDHLPTCEQAEVLYPDQLSLEYLETVYVEEDDHHDKVAGLLQDFGYGSVEVSVKPEKFVGRTN